MTIIAQPGAFYYQVDGQTRGEVTYKTDPNRPILVLDHTYVDPALRGQNIARQLVDAVVAQARMENKKIQPACRYAAVLFRRFADEYQDVALPSRPEDEACRLD
ncbi:GNAT family N-acetyltransferase [Fructobacillus ficulneus]|uniref:GNAT family acetyltransferase n=1 Tax=Fructobacillus ficulneus TaxID=157463 RepID=A0A0K8MHP8_9LACO|nr:GNAT family N-acetyltransferase [Fructobacillus ficulneus]GAO99414.1 GNAT family acetyltransferase [Fructobacillus ficulneus]